MTNYMTRENKYIGKEIVVFGDRHYGTYKVKLLKVYEGEDRLPQDIFVYQAEITELIDDTYSIPLKTKLYVCGDDITDLTIDPFIESKE